MGARIQRIAWLLAAGPFIGIAVVLTDIVSPWQAVGNAALLFALICAHALCYGAWQPHAPDRILVNELLTRLWFATYLVLLVGLLDGALAVAALGFPLAVSSWLVHRRSVRSGYNAAPNVFHLGAFLLLLAGILVVAVP